MDLLEQNLAVLNEYIAIRLQSRGFFDRLLDTALKIKFDPKRIFNKWSKLCKELPTLSVSKNNCSENDYDIENDDDTIYCEVSDSIIHEKVPIETATDNAPSAASLTSIRVHPFCDDDQTADKAESIYLSPHDHIFALGSINPGLGHRRPFQTRIKETDSNFYYEDSEDERWNNVDEIYATKADFEATRLRTPIEHTYVEIDDGYYSVPFVPTAKNVVPESKKGRSKMVNLNKRKSKRKNRKNRKPSTTWTI